VVEYLPGGTLDARLARGPLSSQEAVATAAELALALARLHDAGVLHRDIKPSNIGFAADGTPKLLDFGVARVLEAAREAAAAPVEWLTAATPIPAATDPAEWGGTPLYLSPEAVAGHRPDVSFDLWALCMVLYESVAGRHPFADDPPARALLRIYDAAVPDARELAPELPPPLTAFLRDALHGDPRRRPASARELHQHLQSLR
jgi:serine/threonine protein kinase